jgi:hypothetical protein
MAIERDLAAFWSLIIERDLVYLAEGTREDRAVSLSYRRRIHSSTSGELAPAKRMLCSPEAGYYPGRKDHHVGRVS